MQISISDEVFARFPAYRRGLVIARGVHNDPSDPELIVGLRAAEDALAAQFSPGTLIAL